MSRQPIRLGLPTVPERASGVEGGLVKWREGGYYRIAGYDSMGPFFMSIMSDSDLWMFVSSRGGLTAGRGDAERSLFPYETVDKLHVAHAHTGPKTIIRCSREDGVYIWQPFADDGRLRYEIERSLYKHVLGCELWFEENNLSLGLAFRYGWRPSERFGWVRTSELANTGDREPRLEILDGVQNILPAGVGVGLQNSFSCLVDAYKTAEADPETGLVVFRLTANIIDRPEASEALRATVAWQSGLRGATTILDSSISSDFIMGREIFPAAEFQGRRGSYLLKDELALASGETRSWQIVLDTPVDQARAVELGRLLGGDKGPDFEADIDLGRDRLARLLAAADAFQASGDELVTSHHISNVLYNIGRGGVLPDQYTIDRKDLTDFLRTRNRRVADRYSAWLAGLTAYPSLGEVHRLAAGTEDADLIRLCYEYLPLVFSRRHGDPSRPWNRFSIAMKGRDGSPLYSYQGNWRDIFQNWDALCRSFPECIEPIVFKFLNASTVDGFNPYRVTREGIDWEMADPDDPWSSIGYWGDHQIVYLVRLLEASVAHHPERLKTMLDRDLFTYADVPYDIKPYAEIVADPHKTIVFNWERQRAADARVNAIGSDGKLVGRNGDILHVNLAEKLMVPILAKLSNLVPEGGIWMNTMRPEWNDANNALVGNGMSVVTACHLYRHLGFCAELLGDSGLVTLEMSSRVDRWIREMSAIILDYGEMPMDDIRRRAFMDKAGGAFSRYRLDVYAQGLGDRVPVSVEALVDLLRRARAMVGLTVRANRRGDSLYNAYNILHLGDRSAAISALPLMLEGQVAALSSGLLTPEESLVLLDALRESPLYREDQRSYILYPVKALPAYLEKNRVHDSILDESPGLKAMLEMGDECILVRDQLGQLRFHPDCHNAEALAARLRSAFPEAEARKILEAYEGVFDHKAFTGRSGTMYGYEGIGCIYWHMVAKLLLAAQEAFERAAAAGTKDAVAGKLKHHYYDIRAGLGFMKGPDEFGAFPLDPYSHTAGFGGARQPGMTGQVKEEILTRWGELGVRVHDGKISFDPGLLNEGEFLAEPADFPHIDAEGNRQSIRLEAGSLGFTFCQVPVIYTRGTENRISVKLADGSERELERLTVTEILSRHVFGRTGHVRRITACIP